MKFILILLLILMSSAHAIRQPKKAEPKRVSTTISFPAGNPTIDSELGSFISLPLIDNADGDTTINFKTGTFTRIPNCSVTATSTSVGRSGSVHSIGVGFIRVLTFFSTSATLADINVTVKCEGN